MHALSMIIHLTICLVAVYTELFRIKCEKRKVSTLFFVNLFFGLYYGIAPILYFICYPYYSRFLFWDHVHINITNFNEDNTLYTAIIVLLAYSVVLLVYFYKNKFTSSEYRYKDLSLANFKLFSILISIVGTVSLIVYIRGIGGIVEAIITAELYRSHDAVVTNYTIYRYLYPWVQLGCVLFLGIGIYTRSKLFITLGIPMFLMTILYLLINAGRSNIFVFFGIFFLIYAHHKAIFSYKILIPILLAGVFLAIMGDEVFQFFVTGKFHFTNNIYKIILILSQQLSFVYVNVLKVHSFSLGKDQLYYFSDLYVSAINLLPGSIEQLFNLGIENTTKMHTSNFNAPSGTGIIVDLVTYGYYQFALPGVFIISAFIGIISRFLDWFFRRPGIICNITVCWTGFFIMGIMGSMDLTSIILARSHYWFPILFVIFLSKRKSLTIN